MGFKANVDGLSGMYCKVEQVNLLNEHEKEILEDGTVNELKTYPLAVVVGVYPTVDKLNKTKVKEHHVSYDMKSSDNPIAQAYEQIKSEYDIVEDNV